MNKFIFDVDGTLTPSRGVIDPKFKEFFNAFCRSNPVYLVTGSDKPKTVEQIGEDTYNLCYTVYNCSGCDVYQGKKNIKESRWRISEIAHQWLENELFRSKFNLRTGNHIEQRTGMVNFSIVGRNANFKERQDYVKWDKKTKERIDIAQRFNLEFPHLEAKVGGETGIDIAPYGADKSQIIEDFNTKDVTWFFGDAIYKGGNDYPLAQVVSHYRQVSDWRQTMEYLQIFQEQGIAA